MNTEMLLKEIRSMNQALGVFSTVSQDGKPQAASMYYVYDDAMNFYFVTRSESRKYKNLRQNPNISLVLTTDHPPKTIQIEGTAQEVMDPQEQITYFNELMAKAHQSVSTLPVEQIPAGEMVFMKFTPNWVRVGDFILMREGDHFVEAKLG